jgi:3-deoxy-D-manno-octulosonate 8-phosphate phosphatase (KDO 8-P phosphatase)
MKNLKMLIMDVDGTLTDGKLYISSSGEVMKAFSIKDGYAIKNILPQLGIIPVIITGRVSNAVRIRAGELGISELHEGIDDKLEICRKLMEKYGLKDENVAFIGDDCNDIPMFSCCGFTACPNNAAAEVKQISSLVLQANGGEGAVREYIEHIRKEKEK